MLCQSKTPIESDQHEMLSYSLRSIQLHKKKLPKVEQWAFDALVFCTLVLFFLAPNSMRSNLLTLMKWIPGFSMVIMYHHKLAAAAQIEFKLLPGATL